MGRRREREDRREERHGVDWGTEWITVVMLTGPLLPPVLCSDCS